MRPMVSAFALALLCAPAHAAEPYHWVSATKPITACSVRSEDLAEGNCKSRLFSPGQSFLYDPANADGPDGTVELFLGVCHTCGEHRMTPVYVSHSDWPHAFKRVSTPQGWR